MTINQLRGLHRVLARETNVSDLLQHLTDLDPDPWLSLVGFVPHSCSREFKLAKVGKRRGVKGTADLVLGNPDGEQLLLELKLAHAFTPDQRRRYEESTDGGLLLAGLAADEALVRDADRWSYLPLATIFKAWTSSNDPNAAALAAVVTSVLESWDHDVSAVFDLSDSTRRPLNSIRHKFLARVVTRQIADRVELGGWDAEANVTKGGGLAIAQGWARIRGDENRCLTAEIRWWEGMRGGELRFGVDFWLPETESSRREAWALATEMAESISIDALRDHLATHDPRLAGLLLRPGTGRPDPNCDWLEVVARGFKSSGNPDGVAGNRRSLVPGFVGDGTQRFEAVTPVDFDSATATDLVHLLTACLDHLRLRLPSHLQN